MSRNRMRNSHSLHLMGVIKWFVIVAIVAVLGLGYMICKNQNYQLATETQKLQEQLVTLKQQNNEMEIKLERMKTPDQLKHLLAKNGSNLVYLGDSRIHTMDAQVEVANYVPEKRAHP